MGARQRIETRRLAKSEQDNVHLIGAMFDLAKTIELLAEEKLPCVDPLTQIHDILKILIKNQDP